MKIHCAAAALSLPFTKRSNQVCLFPDQKRLKAPKIGRSTFLKINLNRGGTLQTSCWKGYSGLFFISRFFVGRSAQVDCWRVFFRFFVSRSVRVGDGMDYLILKRPTQKREGRERK